MTDRTSNESSGRRSPAPEERQRDAERTRRRLLAAALDVFAEQGFAGARVQRIADRAGVNKQLITYYFGGKDGLYRALQEQWLRREEEFASPDLPLDELLAAYLRSGFEDPRLGRLLAWEGLTESAGTSPADHPPEDLSDLHRRQEDGQLPADLDVGAFLLAFMGAAMVPTVLPQVVRRVTGLAPDSPEFERFYTDQLRRIIRHLGR
ncbi:TetR family transcriptional regulator [Nocardia otitidiscaviarum]|uniref:TetR family transcriptional regulator n=1 Tax=Nocardia otitidiscaviarum TaxID=1823 RepID=A0A516NGB1_9NOCA|nr:TetR/AcrR family transcriptional regulator [Nocardia otitidiscaviarum]MCP9623311.1 TetR/AcrR family transcriptional regulator [Nocardia otitidiscaviarum]QDP77942.1 TetR family transcriptional regulator [Nocardia otitidiscaviarum]